MTSRAVETNPLNEPPTFRPEEYTVGWICAVPIELAAVLALLDQTHGPLDGQPKYDENHYHLGAIGKHKVTITCLSSYGTINTATAAKSMQATFPGLRFGLMVGIGGGIPSRQSDIRLGDIVVSLPTERHGGVVQYDLGRSQVDGFHRVGVLNSPPKLLLGVLPTMQVMGGLSRKIFDEVRRVFEKNEDYDEKWAYPGSANDNLFKADATHTDVWATCAACISAGIDMASRTPRKNEWPNIHYGNIASGNTVVKDPKVRDQLGEKENVICVEMEAAGLMNDFPCLVIRGICDYADSHKNGGWQRYAAAVAAVYTKKLLEQIAPAAVQKMEPIPQTHWVVPFGRNKDFIGRKSQLQHLTNLLDPSDLDDCQRVAISGLGGIGKTQIALEIAYRMQEKCSVFWVPAVDVASFEFAYRVIGEKLNVPGLKDDKADIKSLVKAALSQESAGKWLMILDNADDLDVLFERASERDNSIGSGLIDYLPFSRKGSILFTTRNSRVAIKAAGKNLTELKEMTKDDSCMLLETSLCDKSLVENKKSVEKLMELLQYLPLAIKQAAVCLNENSMSINDYIAIYQSNDESLIELLSENFEDYGRYQNARNPIASTWLISFRQIEQMDQLAAGYLYTMSCIAQQDIPHSILSPDSEFKERKAIATLKAYAFITERAGERSYDMHRLVHIALQNWSKTRDQFDVWRTRTIERLCDIFPNFDHERRDVCLSLIPHAMHVLSTHEEFSEDNCQAEPYLLSKLGRYYVGTGSYFMAETMHRWAVELSQKEFGMEDPRTLSSQGELARTLRKEAKFFEAERLARQTLISMEDILGPEHPDTLKSIGCLAIILMRQEEHSEAQRMLEQTLLSMEKVLGREHSNTLHVLSDLAIVYGEQENHAKAEAIFRKELKLREKIHGVGHYGTLLSMYNIGHNLNKQGKFEEAKTMHQQTLELREKVLNTDHPDIFRSKWGLADALVGLGQYKEAVALLQEACEGLEKSLGDAHPRTQSCQKKYAWVLAQMDGQSQFRNTIPNSPASSSHLDLQSQEPQKPLEKPHSSKTRKHRRRK